MMKNEAKQWVLFTHTAYRSEEQARKMIDRQVNMIVLNALDDAARMTSAIRGVNSEQFLKLKQGVLNARDDYKIVKLHQATGWS